MRKWKLRKFMWPTKGITASNLKDQDSNPGRLTSKRVHAATHRKQLRLGVSEKASPKQGLGSWILRDEGCKWWKWRQETEEQ